MAKLSMVLALGLALVAGSAMAQDATKAAQDQAAADKAAAEKAMTDKAGTAAKPVDAPAVTTTVAAAPPPPPIKRVKMRSLLSAGYEIKAVTFVPQDASSRVSKTLDQDAALVTLQKGSAAATCFYTLVDYTTTPRALDIEWCIEQK
jgi:hypothetical protein